MREKVNCPFCESDGCCFCDYNGFVFVGENEEIKSKDFVNSIGVKIMKDQDEEYGGLESWKEGFHFMLDEKNIPILKKAFPNYFKQK